jgi:hypothetical protein
MSRYPNRPALCPRRSGSTTALIILGMLLPLAAQAASKVCAPDNRGCYYTRVKCSDVYLPKGWSCAAKLAVDPQKHDRLVRQADGRVVVLEVSNTTYLLSDELEAKVARGRQPADEVLRLASTDRGPVSETSVQQLGKDLGLPIDKALAPAQAIPVKRGKSP